MTAITTIAGTDIISNSRSTINTNFSNLNSGKVEVTSPSQVRVVLSGDQNINANTLTKVTFDTEIFDTGNEFSTSTNTFTPAATGYYMFSVNILRNPQTAFTSGDLLTNKIYVNGTANAIFNGHASASTGGSHSVELTALLSLTAGDAVIIQVQDTPAVTLTAINSLTFMTIVRVA